MKVVDEIVDAFGWIQEERVTRTSHALAAAGRVWLFDIVDDPELDARIRELGEPAAVVQLLDRHRVGAGGREVSAHAGTLPGTRARPGWAQRGSNPRHLPCKGSALPLSYTPRSADRLSEPEGSV